MFLPLAYMPIYSFNKVMITYVCTVTSKYVSLKIVVFVDADNYLYYASVHSLKSQYIFSSTNSLEIRLTPTF